MFDSVSRYDGWKRFHRLRHYRAWHIRSTAWIIFIVRMDSENKLSKRSMKLHSKLNISLSSNPKCEKGMKKAWDWKHHHSWSKRFARKDVTRFEKQRWLLRLCRKSSQHSFERMNLDWRKLKPCKVWLILLRFTSKQWWVNRNYEKISISWMSYRSMFEMKQNNSNRTLKVRTQDNHSCDSKNLRTLYRSCRLGQMMIAICELSNCKRWERNEIKILCFIWNYEKILNNVQLEISSIVQQRRSKERSCISKKKKHCRIAHQSNEKNVSRRIWWYEKRNWSILKSDKSNISWIEWRNSYQFIDLKSYIKSLYRKRLRAKESPWGSLFLKLNLTFWCILIILQLSRKRYCVVVYDLTILYKKPLTHERLFLFDEDHFKDHSDTLRWLIFKNLFLFVSDFKQNFRCFST